MKFTVENYFDKIQEYGPDNLPPELKATHEFVYTDLTGGGQTWELYWNDPDMKEIVDEYFSQLNELNMATRKARSKKRFAEEVEKKRQEMAPDITPAVVPSHWNNAKFKIDQKVYINGRPEAYTIDSLIGPNEKGELEYLVKNQPGDLIPDYIRESQMHATSKEDKPAHKSSSNTEPSKAIPIVPAGPKTEHKTEPLSPPEEKSRKRTAKPKEDRKGTQGKRGKISYEHAKGVEIISPDVQFIKAWALMHGKPKTVHQIQLFIKKLIKAIREKRISKKHSKYHEEIDRIQHAAIKFYDSMKDGDVVEIPADELNNYLQIAGMEKRMLSVLLLQHYYSLAGKKIEREAAKKLNDRIAKESEKERLLESDPYIDQIKAVAESLADFLNSKQKTGILKIHPAQLNGIYGILNGCGCLHPGLNGLEDESEDEDLEGIEHEPESEEEVDDIAELSGIENQPEAYPAKGNPKQGTIMNSEQFARLHFDTLGWNGKWRQFFGDPVPPFLINIYGRPKFGKSYLSVELAGDLADEFGRTLYVAREEGLKNTLQIKLKEKQAISPNLDVSDYLPRDLSNYQYVFIDTVTVLQLTPADIRKLSEENPDTSFVNIYQVNKQGDIRGSMEFDHDADMIVRVTEKGFAVQDGRYNQGAELRIFEDEL